MYTAVKIKRSLILSNR